MATERKNNSSQFYGRKNKAVVVTDCKASKGLIKINGVSNELVKKEILRYKAFEPIILAGVERLQGVGMRISVKRGGKTSQIYVIRQSIAMALVGYFQEYVDEYSKSKYRTSS